MTSERSAQVTELVVDGLKYPEGLRWHEDRLWFSDMHTHEVIAMTPVMRITVAS